MPNRTKDMIFFLLLSRVASIGNSQTRLSARSERPKVYLARKINKCSLRIIITLIEHRFYLLKSLHRLDRRFMPNRTRYRYDMFSLLKAVLLQKTITVE